LNADQKALVIMQIELIQDLDDELSSEKRTLLLDKLKSTISGFGVRTRLRKQDLNGAVYAAAPDESPEIPTPV